MSQLWEMHHWMNVVRDHHKELTRLLSGSDPEMKAEKIAFEAAAILIATKKLNGTFLWRSHWLIFRALFKHWRLFFAKAQ
jgi:hypothetical protein